MSWTVGNTSNGSGSNVTSFTPTLPTGLADGDIIVIETAFTPDDGSRNIVCSTPNWYSGPSNAAYCIYARYSAAISAPTITVTNSLTATVSWFAASYRPTKQSFFGTGYEAAGAPPATTTVTVNSLDTLIVCIGVTAGTVVSWVGPAGFTVQRNDINSPATYMSYSIQTSVGSVSGVGAYNSLTTNSARTIVIPIAEGGPQGFFTDS